MTTGSLTVHWKHAYFSLKAAQLWLKKPPPLDLPPMVKSQMCTYQWTQNVCNKGADDDQKKKLKIPTYKSCTYYITVKHSLPKH